MTTGNTENSNEKKVLVTGTAGFIGFHFAKRLTALGYKVIGIDNLNDYYDVGLKLARLKELGFTDQQLDRINDKESVTSADGRLVFYPKDLKDKEPLGKIFKKERPDYVVHLAAQAGVRYSIDFPYKYIDSNIIAFMNILESCRHYPVEHLVFSSSSSVYGSNERMPFSVHHNVDHPISLYAATKKSNELMAHAYSHLYKVPATGLRFFTVYGPWGRPDMAYFLFTKKILNDDPIQVFNHGDMKRDFTYVDDIVEGVYKVMLKTPASDDKWNGENPDPATSAAPYRLFNIGNNQPVNLGYFIELLEKNLGRTAKKKLLPMQQGDVKETYADIEALREHTGFQPSTSVEEGIAAFVKWYLKYYEIKQ
jgi:UDP-glucuronate 4-epimerase